MEAGKKSSKKSVKKRSRKQNKQRYNSFDLFLLMILTAFIGGSVITSAKISLQAIPPFTLTFFIFLLTYLITASILVGKNNRMGSKNFNDNFFPAFFIVANLLALFFALNYTTALMVAVIYVAVPLISISYLKIFNKRNLVCDQKMGLLLGGMGLCLVVFQPIIQLCSNGNLDVALGIIGGNLLALASAIFSTFYVFNRQKYTKKTITPISIIFYASLMAMIISVAPMLFIEFQDFGFVSNIDFEHIASAMWLSIVGILAFNVVYQFFIREKNTLFSYQLAQPIFGVIIAIMLLGEFLPWLVIVGAIMMLIGGRMIFQKIKSVSSKNKKKNKKTKTVSAKRKSDKLSVKTKGVEGGVNKLGVFILLIIAGATAGSIPTAGKIAMQTGLTPLALLFFRYVIAFVFMLPIIVQRNELSMKDFKNNFLPSFLAVMNPIVLFYALSYTTASVSILIYAAGPLFMALYHKFFCNNKLTQNQLIGLGVGFVGVALILFQPIAKGGVGTVAGNLMVIISTLFFVSYTIFSGKQQTKKLASPYSLVFYSSIVAMAISFIPMLQTINKADLGLPQIGAIVWLGLISTVVFFILFQFIVKREGTLVASVYAYLQATLGAIIGLVVLGEKITLLIVFGAILTFIGAKIVTQKVKEKKKRRKPRKKVRKSAKKKTAKKSMKTSSKNSEKKVESKKVEEKKIDDSNKTSKRKIVKEDEKVSKKEVIEKVERKDDNEIKEGDVIQVRVIGGNKK